MIIKISTFGRLLLATLKLLTAARLHAQYDCL
jgi:hypothetical protein